MKCKECGTTYRADHDKVYALGVSEGRRLEAKECNKASIRKALKP